MYRAAASAGGSQADSAALLELRRSLETQAVELRAVLARLRHARSLLPDGSHQLWHGLAQLAYSLGLGRLRSELAVFDERLDRALRNTGQAVDVLDRRVR